MVHHQDHFPGESSRTSVNLNAGKYKVTESGNWVIVLAILQAVLVLLLVAASMYYYQSIPHRLTDVLAQSQEGHGGTKKPSDFTVT